jgi:hypothetical protein
LIARLPFFDCTLGDEIDLGRTAPAPGPDLVRDVMLSNAGAFADIAVRVGSDNQRVLQASWVAPIYGAAIRASSQPTLLTLRQANDDTYYPQSTPWTLDGLWPEGVLFHREADEQGCELFWAPAGGRIVPIDAQKFDCEGRAFVAGDRLVLVHDRDAISYALDGTQRGHAEAADTSDAQVVVARVDGHAAIALVARASLPAVPLVPLEPGQKLPAELDLVMAIPPRPCAAAPAANALFGLGFDFSLDPGGWLSPGGGTFDLELDQRGACVRALNVQTVSVRATAAGMVGFDASAPAQQLHQRATSCRPTAEPPPPPGD